MSDDSAIPFTDGTIPFLGHRTWYRSYGTSERLGRLPLLCLHGGPGGTHDYLEPLRELARSGRRVIFFDQLGSGRSRLEEPHPEMWTVEEHIEEVRAVRAALGLDRIHLYGSSWGGMLAMEYMLTRPEGVASLVLASSPVSMPQWVAEADRLREQLPPEVQATLVRHETAGTTDDPEYKAAAKVFNARHVCRLDPLPEYVQRSYDALDAHPEVYHTMNGPSEFHITGTLRDWDIRNRLGEIAVPTLVTSGRHDEATPTIGATIHRGIRDSEWMIFEGSSHMAHAEEPELYLAVLDEFLGRVEAGGTSDGSARSTEPSLEIAAP